MRERVIAWLSWVDEHRVRATWIAVAVLVLFIILRIAVSL
jgi:hypothetical protein